MRSTGPESEPESLEITRGTWAVRLGLVVMEGSSSRSSLDENSTAGAGRRVGRGADVGVGARRVRVLVPVVGGWGWLEPREEFPRNEMEGMLI